MRSLKFSLAAILVLCVVATPMAQEAVTLTRGNGIIGSDIYGSKRVVLTNAQVLTLGATPVTILGAIPTNSAYDVIGVSLNLKYTSTYSAGGDLKLWYGSRTAGAAASATITASGLLTSLSASSYKRVSGTPDNTNLNPGAAVVLQGIASTAFTGGNSANTLTVDVIYRIVAVQ